MRAACQPDAAPIISSKLHFIWALGPWPPTDQPSKQGGKRIEAQPQLVRILRTQYEKGKTFARLEDPRDCMPRTRENSTTVEARSTTSNSR